MTTNYHATETLVQEVVSKSCEIFQTCKHNFYYSISSSNLSEVNKDTAIKSFDDSFSLHRNAFDNAKGFLRNSYNSKMYYRDNLNLTFAVEEILVNDDGEDSGCRYSYVPLLDTISLM